MTRLSLAHLQMMSTIRNSPSLGEAAETLGITPSALSHRIREAERRLGVTLFAKAGRRMRPTAAAEILTETADHVLERLALAERAAAASAHGVRHVVRLTVCDYNAYHWLAEFLVDFRRSHPAIDIEIEPNALAGALKRIAEGGVDIAILPVAADNAAPDHPHGEAMELFADELVVVLWPDHPLAASPFISARDFEEEIYLTYSLASRPGFESERLWLQEGTLPLHKRNLGSVDAVCELVKARAGISILSRWGITREIEAGTLIARPAGPKSLPIVWRALLPQGVPEGSPVRDVTAALARWFRSRPG